MHLYRYLTFYLVMFTLFIKLHSPKIFKRQLTRPVDIFSFSYIFYFTVSFSQCPLHPIQDNSGRSHFWTPVFVCVNCMRDQYSSFPSQENVSQTKQYQCYQPLTPRETMAIKLRWFTLHAFYVTKSGPLEAVQIAPCNIRCQLVLALKKIKQNM